MLRSRKNLCYIQSGRSAMRLISSDIVKTPPLADRFGTALWESSEGLRYQSVLQRFKAGHVIFQSHGRP